MRSVFRSTSGFLGRIESATRCAFWADEPTLHDYDPALLITVDLERTPNAALAGEIAWDEIEVDDCYVSISGGLAGTTLGPRWPELQIAGAVYLEDRFIARLPEALRPPCPPKLVGGRAYEHTTVVYWPDGDDPRAGKRYAGHHATVLEQRAGLTRVIVYPPGLSEEAGVRTHDLWIDLTSVEHCDAGPDALTQLGADGAGPLFLLCGRLDLEPKEPA